MVPSFSTPSSKTPPSEVLLYILRYSEILSKSILGNDLNSTRLFRLNAKQAQNSYEAIYLVAFRALEERLGGVPKSGRFNCGGSVMLYMVCEGAIDTLFFLHYAFDKCRFGSIEC